MSLMVSPVADLVTTLEHRLRIAQSERRYRVLTALATPAAHPSRRIRLQTRLGSALIVAGERLHGEPRLKPVVG